LHIDRANTVIAVLMVSVVLTGAVFVNRQGLTKNAEKELFFSRELSLKQLAAKNGVPPGELRYKLSHEVGRGAEIPMQKPIKALGIEERAIRKALEHALESAGSPASVVKFGLWAVLLSAVVLWVLQGRKVAGYRAAILLGSVVVFGVILGVSPNPMESVVKLFKMLRGIQGGTLAVVANFVIFSLLSLWGAKLICSWGCQLGALQESVFNIPVLKKYRVRVPFALSIGVRIILFCVFIVLLFNIGVHVKNFVIYHHVNYFKVFNFGDLATIALYTLPVMLIASLFIWRPFCQFICPFGLWAWVLENFALNRIRIDRRACVECGRCRKSCPTDAMKVIYEKGRKLFGPDCWSCGKCIDACAKDAVHYGIGGKETGENS